MSKCAVVETNYGKIRGVVKSSALGKDYFAFLGVPYAAPPVGNLRFKDPLPPSKWENIYDATQEKSPCVGHNFHTNEIVGSEDCLFLNIFTKSLKPEKLQPVMIYIHGGGFNGGSSSTELLGPDYFLMADVVIVTLNYRLGALGFLSLEDEKLKIPGNAGLKDQVMAMKFVKNSIESFGGDSNNVTLFGHSAGGSSVSWHCVSEMSRGLFQKAIIMSGCVLNKFSLIPRRNWASRLAWKLGYEGDENEKEILEFLMQADSFEILKFQDNLVLDDEKTKISFAFGPHIESYESDETFNIENPIDLVRKAWSNEIDVMIGGTSDEGLMYLEYVNKNPKILEYFKLESLIPPEVNLSENLKEKFIENLRKTYFPNGMDPTKDKNGFVKVKSDQAIWHGMHRLVQSRQNSRKNGKTYLYRFSVDSPTQNLYRITHLGKETRGVCHADELSYLFKSIYVDVPDESSLEFKSIRRFVSLFTSFATNGDPNSNVINAEIETDLWKPVDGLEPPFGCLNIGEKLSFEIHPDSDRFAVWDEIYLLSGTPLY